MAAVKAEGVAFANSHAMYPTLTTVNAASIASGHYPGDTGDDANARSQGRTASRPCCNTSRSAESAISTPPASPAGRWV